MVDCDAAFSQQLLDVSVRQPGIPIVLADANPAVAWSLESGYLPENVIVAPIRRHRRRVRAAETASAANERISALCACGGRIGLSASIVAQQSAICGVCGTQFRAGYTHPARPETPVPEPPGLGRLRAGLAWGPWRSAVGNHATPVALRVAATFGSSCQGRLRVSSGAVHPVE
jgi:hypothetical protein